MKITAPKLLFLIIAIIIAAHAAKAADKPMVLITAFDPFLDHPKNNSKEVAAGVKYRLEQAGYDARVCVLPVVYDQASKEAVKCFDNSPTKPSMVISLGEGACETEIEDVMVNFDSTPGVPDNAGVIRSGTPILSGQPSQITLSPFSKRLYCGADENVKNNVFPSSSAGNFVCNNTGYRLGLYFKKIQVNFAFMHVPSFSCGMDPMESAERITAMIKGAYKTPSQQCIDDFEQRSSIHKSYEIF